MSYGSICPGGPPDARDRHEPAGQALNTGEGGEDPDRFTPDANGDLRRSAIKQVASGRFGVTGEYLVNADDIQIKMAQGQARRGGQLPDAKVYPWVARTRHSTPGVGLISPPPHHDIYSIEDLKQLIHDLGEREQRRADPRQAGQRGRGRRSRGGGQQGPRGRRPHLRRRRHGCRAADVAQAPSSPWELGLAETQQTLLANGLRDRIVVQVDGQMKTGQDVIVAALLGAGGVRLRDRAAGRLRLRDDAGLSTSTPVRSASRRRTRSCASSSPGSRSSSSRSSSSWPSRCAPTSASWASARSTRRSATPSCSTPARPWTTGRPCRPRPVADARRARAARGAPLHQVKSQDHELDIALDQTLIQLCEEVRCSTRSRSPSSCRCATSTGRSAPCSARW